MTKTVNHVDAKFGGRRVRFELYRDRDTVDRLESVVGSVSACWQRFQAGTWTMADVRTILAVSHPAPASRLSSYAPLSLSSIRARIDGRTEPAPTPRQPRGVDLSAIDAVLSQRPLALYGPLAAMILAAACYGLPAPVAVFDEDAAPAGSGEAAA
ncbi:hypothetical protein ABEV34_04885 [Methylorubrum rhodesianum]|uniref:hypothetical protein n=1 Tax=Methylorubrum rhodesianum TaxID=29427 RepID=UPI003D2828E8